MQIPFHVTNQCRNVILSSLISTTLYHLERKKHQTSDGLNVDFPTTSFKTRDKRRQPGKRYSRIGKLRRLRGQPQGGWKSSRVVESGRCQGQIQLLTPENTETVITETRETADGGPISLSSLLPSPRESFSFGPPFFIPRFQSLRLFAHVSYLDHFPRFSRVLPPFFPRAFFCVGGKK